MKGMKEASLDPSMRQTVEALLAGGVVLYPTDTVWGLGCMAGDENALGRLALLKQRPAGKSMLVLLAAEAAQPLATNPAVRRLLLESERPTTVVVPAGLGLVESLVERRWVSPLLLAADGSLGIRVPRTPWIAALLAHLPGALVSTSANFAGQPTPTGFDDIDPRLRATVDFCVPNLPQHEGCGAASRLVKVEEGGTVVVLRD